MSVIFSDNENYGSVGNAQFANIISDAIRAIREGVYPERIQQGSSGSYFVKNCEGVCDLQIFFSTAYKYFIIFGSL